MFFRFPPDARWNPERSVVEFGIGIGEYEGVVRVSRRVFQILVSEPPRLNGALKPTIFTGPGSNSLPSGGFAAGSSRSSMEYIGSGMTSRGHGLEQACTRRPEGHPCSSSHEPSLAQ
jgi:hypothetical protein